jgi:DNA-directed RNA polymerase subunit RPC12/RpoP
MMQLNLVNASLPQYNMSLPVSGITTKFRPFVVKEEKILLMGLQSKSINQINDAMRNIILACTNNVVDTRKLCAADAEYAFLQIRSKSVGEEVKPQVVCTNCGKETTIKIKLDEITITPTTKPVVDSNIKITDTLAIVMRYPSIHDIDYNKTEVEIAFDLAKRCIESVIVDEQVYQVKDINPQELTDFVDNMMPEQFAKIMDFIQSVPELSYEFQYQCPQCSETVKVQLKSVSDFFR